MKPLDFTTTILVDESPAQVFEAIGNPRGWWSEIIEGTTDKLNAEWFYHYQDKHWCKIRVIELVPEQKIVWSVLDNYFSFIEDKTEWKGTKLIFVISKKGNRTSVKFTHEGLTPQHECFEICEDAWTTYIKDSLYHLITTGKGKPNTKKDTFDAKVIDKWKKGTLVS